ncbi:hypothetical protein [Exiguobacterium qingdaonense]|uniref:hypothetical protein n=1 Tax=Exiguobacterium qingdaonense TaxID=2751251 RepID=UPI001BE50981|nr:hypothetical protein [Exiguobacterium qingdaonense]
MGKGQLIDHLKEASSDGRLTIYMYQKWQRVHGGAPVVELLEKYGSWSNVLREAGLEQQMPRFTKKEMIQMLREAAKEHDSFSSADYRKWAMANDAPTLTEVVIQFGSWKVAMIEANVKSVISLDQKCEIIQSLLDATEELHPLTSTAYARWAKQNQRPSITKVVRRFGSWSQALEEIGISTRELFTEMQMMEALNEAEQEVESLSPWGYEVWQKEMGNRPTLKDIQQMFGSFDVAVKEMRQTVNQRKGG